MLLEWWNLDSRSLRILISRAKYTRISCRSSSSHSFKHHCLYKMSLILFAGLLLPSLSSSRSVYVPRQEVGAFIRGVVSLSISPVNKAELAVTNATDLKKREGAGILPVGNGELGTAYMVASMKKRNTLQTPS